MSLVAVSGMPIIPVGYANRQGTSQIAALGSVTIDAAKEAAIMVGHFRWEDGGSHTIDTTGSSSIQWRTGAVTFASGSTTFKVGIGAVDTTTGPPVRAVNVSDVITFDVAAVFTGGGGGVTGTAWQTSVPTTGTKTIANGDLVAISMQMTALGGADSILVGVAAQFATISRSEVTSFTGAVYANASQLPNVVVVASDGTRGYLYGSYVANVGTTTQSWSNGSSPSEYGNILRFPFPVRAYGIIVGNSFAGDCDLILYSDPLGTPSASATVSVDLNQLAVSTVTTQGYFLFASPVDLRANTDYAVIAKPTSATSVGMAYKTYNDSNHQNSDVLGTSCYAINRSSGAFAAQNSSKDRFTIGLLIGAFDGGGISRARAASGF